MTQLQLVEARERLERAGFEVDQTRVRSAQPFDQVLDQDPNPGEEAEPGSTVTLEVSDGPGTCWCRLWRVFRRHRRSASSRTPA